MHQDSFRSVVCRSLSKSLPSRSKDGSSYPEAVQCLVPCVVTLQPSVCQSYQGREPSWSQSFREERSMSMQREYPVPCPSISKHFAEDLLRGAMDLRESLAMLEGFQAASQSMRQSNKKRRPETAEKSTDIDTIIRETLLRPSNANKKVLPRTVSNNGLHGQLSSSTDAMKNLVKDSLHKKNLLSASKTTHTQQKKVVPKSQTDKSTPSLVAKLMGLDGLPSKNDHSVIKDEKIKTVSSPRALFDTEMPKSKRLLLPAEDSPSNTEMHVSEMLLLDHYNDGMNYCRPQKIISPLCDSPTIKETGSVKQIHREKNMEQVRAKSSKEIKVVSPTSRKQQTKEPTEINRRTREKQKSHLLTERNREGRKGVKPKAGSASHVQKLDKKLAASSSSGSMKPILRKAPSNSRQKTMTRRNVESPTVDEIVAYQSQRETVPVLDESDCLSTEHSATPSVESIRGADWDAESSVDDIRSDLISQFVNESSVSTSSQGESIISSGYADGRPSAVIISTKEEAEITDEIILLLLSDAWFLGRAAAVTGSVGSYDHLTNRYKEATKLEMENRELYLDAAAEQLDRKLGWQQNNSLLCCTGARGERRRAAYYLSLEALLTDISNGIRELSSTYAGGSTGDDSLHIKLERDLWRRNTDAWIDGVWDMGWEDWVSMEETECIVRDAGEHILSLLMEEAALDMSGITL